MLIFKKMLHSIYVKTNNMSKKAAKEIRQSVLTDIKSLLQKGIDINALCKNGNTLLHHAARTGKTELAAKLLINGANFLNANYDGILPLSEKHISSERLHEIRQHYLRMPTYTQAQMGYSSLKIKNYLDELKEKGFLKIPALLDKSSLQEIQNDFNRFIIDINMLQAKGKGVHEHYDQECGYQESQRYYVTNNAFKYSDRLVKVATCNLLCEITRNYLAKPIHLRLAQGMRYEPLRDSIYLLKRLKRQKLKNVKGDQFKWHHDMEDKQVKVMIILTDIGRRDQYMRYAIGTHKLFHPYEKFLHHGLDKNYCKQAMGRENLEIVETTGKAGDAFIFDSNGMHVGTRSPKKVRDTFFLVYTANKQNLWGADVSDQAKQIVFEKDWSHIGNNPIESILLAKKKWEINDSPQRTLPTWINTLNQPENWV